MASKELDKSDFIEMGNRARNFSQLFSLRYTQTGKERPNVVRELGGLERVAAVDEALAALERNMYPWIKAGKRFASANELLASYK
ncbi:hypothetical protein HK104_003372, partial [Borealophlyctis nickersoniae]